MLHINLCLPTLQRRQAAPARNGRRAQAQLHPARWDSNPSGRAGDSKCVNVATMSNFFSMRAPLSYKGHYLYLTTVAMKTCKGTDA